MRFIDSNVFIHAYIKPRRRLQEHEKRIKEEAKAIITRVNGGEEVVTTVVHLGEIANLLEDFMPLETALEVIRGLLMKGNIHIVEISHRDYLSALPVAEGCRVGLNDALAYTFMLSRGIGEIYSFDKDFDKLENVIRVTERP
ncbi:type II toxin-antitoxin system VapC family toxin [Candidatus Bathyarchaeota archaeon]|nr:type II toxin-antitoxin system VapC family toxin [Candidatus Bathyarchaeota archaeon]